MPEREPALDHHAQVVTRICRIIEASDTPPCLAELAGESGLSPAYVHRIFKARIGLTPKAYANAQRAKRMRDKLVRSPSVTHAVYGSGFNSSGRFYDMAHKVLGMTPTQYRSGALRLVIRFAIGSSSLGYVLVAQSDLGICAVLMDDDPQHLERDLRIRFPHAHLHPGDPTFTRWIRRVIAAIEHPTAAHGLPLDIRGTAFQQRVWQALMAIPVGSTASYADIAARIDSPKAIRAVAGACAANAVAVLVPCHRVVRSDGSLSGYRWGAARKKALRDRERSLRRP
jgi:AraC family transcriptional regulator of adaptative response/methylated-DNA-[protein]-cysteine methyltransferase